MTINKLECTNFKNISHMEIELPKVHTIIAPNGYGKTSFLEALRFGLTGITPECEIIKDGADMCQVSVTLTDGDGISYTFTRKKFADKPSKCLIDGKSTTQKSMDSKIAEVIGIPLDKVKIAISSDLVENMKPQELQKFLMEYVDETITIKDICEAIPDATMPMLDIVSAALPPTDITIQMVKEFADICKATRKDLKANLSAQKVLFESKPKEEPLMSREDIQKRLSKISLIYEQSELIKASKASYEAAIKRAKAREDEISSLKERIGKIEAIRPDESEKEALLNKKKKAEDSLINLSTSINGATSALSQLNMTLSALEKPICPISPLITCHENKTVAMEEIKESIKASEEGISALEVEKDKTEESIKVISGKLLKYEENASLYNDKIKLMKQLKELEDTKVELPAKEKFDDFEVPSEELENERFQLNEMLNTWREYEEGIKLSKSLRAVEDQLGDYEALVNAFSDKGAVMRMISEKYMDIFEDACNKISSGIKPNARFSFVADNGVTVFVDFGDGRKRPYEALSGGEKAYMLFVMMCMINELTGTGILFFDELSVMDSEGFKALLSYCKNMEEEDGYDHIVLCAVNHSDTVEAVKDVLSA